MNSRLYGGIHWRYDNEDGLTGGTAVGHFVSVTQLLPIPEPVSWHLLAAGILPFALRRRGSARQVPAAAMAHASISAFPSVAARARRKG
jgi:hypothetical protein